MEGVLSRQKNELAFEEGGTRSVYMCYPHSQKKGKGEEEQCQPEELGKALQNINRMSQKSLFSPMTFYSRRSDPRLLVQLCIMCFGLSIKTKQ